ncbi:MAG: hypothetical protein PHX18_06645 [Candidatus Gastranaerophilales bacterium]|nr:hypothetical protein [Candidatus Gastranaerophilales bacterium]
MKIRKIVFLMFWLLLSALIFVAVNFALSFFFTKELTTQTPKNPDFYIGDLNRLGTTSIGITRKNIYSLKRHIQLKDYNGQRIDMITIGDSVSNGIGNQFYQDSIADNFNFTVLNIPPFGSEIKDVKDLYSIETIIKLANSGYLDEIQPKYILIQSNERYAQNRFSKDYDFTQTAKIEDIKKAYNGVDLTKLTDFVKVYFQKGYFFINKDNFNYLKNITQLKLFPDKPLNNQVLVRDLSKPLFSTYNHNDKILFFVEDTEYASQIDKKKLEKLNNNFNELAALLKKHNIELIFMPTVDKTTLYRDYVKGEKYPQSMFFPYMREFKKEYIFIDTDKILKGSLENGEKDVFWPNDTHWTQKAGQIIFSKENKEKFSF